MIQDGSVAIGDLAFDSATQAELNALLGRSAFARSTLDAIEFVHYCTSVTNGSDGLGLIGYFDVTNNDLKVVHLSNRLGVPFHRAR